MAGNEDCGQMSAWYVLSALGFYAVDPVSGNYVLGTPLFESARSTSAGGKTLIIEAKRTSPSQKYVQSVALNGKPLDRLWVRHSDLVNGATPSPSPWATSPTSSSAPTRRSRHRP